MDLGIKGKTAIVTASSSGIGRAVVEALAGEGCKVAICSRTKEPLLKTVREIKSKFNIEPFWGVCDLNQQKDIDNYYEAVKKSFW